MYLHFNEEKEKKGTNINSGYNNGGTMKNMANKSGNLGDRLKELRIKKRLTQKELSDKLYVSDKTISKWEQNKSSPDLDLLIELSIIFDVSLDYLITGLNNHSNSLKVYYDEDGKVDHYTGIDGDRLFTRSEITTILQKRYARHDQQLASMLGLSSIEDVKELVPILNLIKNALQNKNEELKETYFKKFNEYPPKLITVSYNNDIYKELMEKAIITNIPISQEDVEKAFAGISLDISRK